MQSKITRNNVDKIVVRKIEKLSYKLNNAENAARRTFRLSRDSSVACRIRLKITQLNYCNQETQIEARRTFRLSRDSSVACRIRLKITQLNYCNQETQIEVSRPIGKNNISCYKIHNPYTCTIAASGRLFSSSPFYSEGSYKGSGLNPGEHQIQSLKKMIQYHRHKHIAYDY
ncbi:hypothetical protein HELRODRAFT_163917 [Helobdella robusta]|uniref:Uncharacterized protein n=1 Tax=Helobdella robusta TaxID=6412 RepID=T1EUM4_HELRO|nr:hypothetical protein HELRODRAFT_163917 [Helobdella robusta]ESN96794.1 hypothetical protein HELRODRAFT_163917 [Helobdella robusta]